MKTLPNVNEPLPASVCSVPIGQLIKLLKKYQRYPIGIANCLSNDPRYVRDDIVDLDAVRTAIKDGSILDLRNFGKKRARELADLLGLPRPVKPRPVCPHCGRPMHAQNAKTVATEGAVENPAEAAHTSNKK